MRLAVSSPIKGQKIAKAMIHHILLLSNLDMRTSEYRRYLLGRSWSGDTAGTVPGRDILPVGQAIRYVAWKG